MSRKRIFILDGHPARQSLCRGLAEAYSDAAQAAGHNVRLVHLNDLAFDMDTNGPDIAIRSHWNRHWNR